MKFKELSLSKRFVLLMSGLVLMNALTSQMFFARQERTSLETRLREKAAFINNFYAFLIADSLVRKDDITLLQVVNRLEEDREISSVIVVDQKNQVRYDANPNKVGGPSDDTSISNALQTGEATVSTFNNSGGKALALITPLKVQGLRQSIGAIRINLTYRQIDMQIKSSRQRFWFIILGSMLSCAGIVLTCMSRWLFSPMQELRAAIGAINPSLPEPNLQESPDELGEVRAAINDLALRFKGENQHQWTSQKLRAEQEKAWIKQLVSSFLPQSRLIVADKDNQILSDSGNGAPTKPEQRHLLDLIKDTNFATLVNVAFQKEGELVQGPVTFQRKNYMASILSVPAQQSVVVKTLIALQLN